MFGDEVCRGCKRFQNEVIDWNGYEDSQKTAVLTRLESLKTQIMESKISIVNKKLLQNQPRRSYPVLETVQPSQGR